MSTQRFQPIELGGMLPCHNGGWVRHDDFSALEDQNRLLREALNALADAAEKGRNEDHYWSLSDEVLAARAVLATKP